MTKPRTPRGGHFVAYNEENYPRHFSCLSTLPGARVTVQASDGTPLGLGTYDGLFKYAEDADRDRLDAHVPTPNGNPRIRLDSGVVLWGFECWWQPITAGDGA